MQKVRDKKWTKLLTHEDTQFKVVTVKLDRNCFYRCLSMYFYKDESLHEKVRNEIVDYMIDNKNSK